MRAMTVVAGGGTRDLVECPACGKFTSEYFSECAACGEFLPLVIRRGFGLPHVTVEIAPGTVVDSRYEVIAPLRKGMFKAHDLRDGNTVALNILRWALHHQPEYARSWRLKIDKVCKVHHPNVCSVLRYGETESAHGAPTHYIVSELAEGTDLAMEVKTRGPLPHRDAFAVAIAAAEGLQAVHDAGARVEIRVGWLQPKSIVRDSRQNVRLTDLEAALIADAEYPLTGPIGDPPPLAYFSPEMFSSRFGGLDHRADIWSLAAIVFEIFTGHMLFPQQTVQALFKHVTTEPLRLNENNLLPEGVEAILSKALMRDPNARLSSAAEFAAKLRLADNASSTVR